MEKSASNLMLPAPVAEFLNQHTTMTLSTVGAEGRPAAAPLFYAILQDGALLFISEASTEHVRNLLVHPQVALAIYKDVEDWQEVRGLQARGKAVPLPPEREGEAWEVYRKRFPFLGAIIKGTGRMKPLAQALTRSRWYVVHLTWVRLIDNRRGFGWKAEWQRGEDGWEQVR